MKAKAARWALYALALTFFSAATATAAPGVATDVRASQGRFADRIEISWTAAPGAAGAVAALKKVIASA